jgi:hypothetical protein
MNPKFLSDYFLIRFLYNVKPSRTFRHDLSLFGHAKNVKVKY